MWSFFPVCKTGSGIASCLAAYSLMSLYVSQLSSNSSNTTTYCYRYYYAHIQAILAKRRKILTAWQLLLSSRDKSFYLSECLSICLRVFSPFFLDKQLLMPLTYIYKSWSLCWVFEVGGKNATQTSTTTQSNPRSLTFTAECCLPPPYS